MERTVAPARKKVIVIGAGIAGLSAAYYLRKQGIDVDVIEREKIVGGNIRTALKEDRYLVEYGPSSFSSDAKPIIRLARELSIDSQIVDCRIHPQKRYIFHKRRFYRVPRGAVSILAGGLVSPIGRIRLSLEPLIRSRSDQSESLAEFTIRRAGRFVLGSYVEPLATMMCAGDPTQLEAASVMPGLLCAEREYGSVLLRIGRVFGDLPTGGIKSFRWGMGTLTARLEEELRRNIMTNVSVDRIGRVAGGRKVSVAIDVAARTLYADAVIIATPAPEAARLLMDVDQEILSHIMGIPYVSLVVVHTAFKADEMKSKFNGIDFAIPRSEGIRMLGSVMTASSFSGRCPGDEFLITSFMGGATDPDIIDCGDDEIKSLALLGLKKTLGLDDEPGFIQIRRWRQVIPQYTVGHAARISSIEEHLVVQPGIFLTGNYLSGLSVENTIAHARGTVERVLEYFKATRKTEKNYRTCEAALT